MQEQEPSLPGQREGGLPPSFAPLGLGSTAPTSPAVNSDGTGGSFVTGLNRAASVDCRLRTYSQLPSRVLARKGDLQVGQELEREENGAGRQLSKAHQPSMSKMMFRMQGRCEWDKKKEYTEEPARKSERKGLRCVLRSRSSCGTEKVFLEQ